MNLLGAILYDPSVAVNKVTTSAIAMTALDTTNLRLAITVPAHGRVRFRLAGTLHGATTMPQILLGVMNGSTVIGRVSPMHGATNIAATSQVKVEADFIVSGLTPGAMNCDAAYGVETLVASTGLKYGGPNDTTANNAFGGFVFEAWDPQPQTANSTLAVDSSGRVTAGTVSDKTGYSLTATTGLGNQTANITGNLSGSVGSVTGAVTVGTINSGVITAASIAASALDSKGNWNIGKTGYSLTQAFPTNFSSLAITGSGAVTAGTVSDKTGYSLSAGGVQAIWDALTSALTTANSIGKWILDKLDVVVSSRGTGAALDAAGVRSAVGLASASLDLQLGLIDDDTAAIRAQTDNLVFVSGKVNANVKAVNDVIVNGDGAATPWGP